MENSITMENTIVYISKSNQAHIHDLLKVKTQMKERGFKILEHTGGDYDPGLVKKSDIIIVVPAREYEIDQEQSKILVGKGVGTEVKMKKNKRFVYDFRNDIYRSIDAIDVNDTDDWKWTFYVLILGEEINLSDITDEPDDWFDNL